MRSFIGFGQVNYIGTPQAQPIKLAGIAGQAIPLLFQWVSYNAAAAGNVNVLVDVSTKPCSKLDQIRSIYIDNLGSDVPIYVHFPDSNYSVVAKPNSEGWYPAFTNQFQVWVVGQGFLSGDIPTTFIILSNIPIIPAVNNEIDTAVALWKASAQITRGSTIYNTNFGTPALGDQVTTPSLNLQGPLGSTIPLFGTPGSSGFIYLSAISVHAMNVQNAAAVQATQTIESTGISGTLYNFSFTVAANVFYANEDLMTIDSVNLKLDATQTWRIRLVAGILTSGYFQYYLHFTDNPT